MKVAVELVMPAVSFWGQVPVYRKRHKGRIRFLEQTLLPVDPGGRWGNTLGVMVAK